MDETIVSGALDGRVMIWNIATGEHTNTLKECSLKINDLSFSPCGSYLAFCSVNQVAVYECDSWLILHTFELPSPDISKVKFNRSSEKIVAASSEDSVLYVLSLITNSIELRFQMQEKYINSVSVYLDLAVISCGSQVGFWDLSRGELIKCLSGHRNLIGATDVSWDDRLLVTGSYDTTVMIWDIAPNSIVHVLRSHTNFITGVKFNRDATRVISCAYDKAARVWDVSTGESLFTLRHHTAAIFSCCFSEDDSKIITCGLDKTIRVCDSSTGEELRILTGHLRGVLSVACRPSSIGSYI